MTRSIFLERARGEKKHVAIGIFPEKPHREYKLDTLLERSDNVTSPSSENEFQAISTCSERQLT